MNGDSIQEVRFHNPHLTRVGIEVLALADLRRRIPDGLKSPQRVDFHLLLMVQAGRGHHRVDFVDHALRPGTLLLVRPGQVQQWHMQKSLQGLFVLISNLALAPSVSQSANAAPLPGLDEWPVVSHPGRVLWEAALKDVKRLKDDIQSFDGSEIEVAIAQQALSTLLLRLSRDLAARSAKTISSREAEVYRLFARELETSFHTRHGVLDYARRLGYSQSTLSRACTTATGRTAKQVIDRRRVLEAKRLLVHSQASTVNISHQLGFTEPTNFVKFFKRLEGTTPQAFRISAGL